MLNSFLMELSQNVIYLNLNYLLIEIIAIYFYFLISDSYYLIIGHVDDLELINLVI